MIRPQTISTKYLLSILALVFLTAVFLFSASSAAAAQTRYVDGAAGADSGGCANPAAPCKTIGYALNQANSGDEIKVALGVYKENLLITSSIDLLGGFDPADWQADPAPFASVIDGQRLDSVLHYEMGAGGILDGFKITRGKAELGGGIFSEFGFLTLQNLWIVDNEATDSGGGVYINEGLVFFDSSELEDNQAANFGGAMHLANSTGPLTALRIAGNEAANGGAVSLNNTGKIELIDSELLQNMGTSQSGALHLVDAFLEIEDTLIHDNQAGDHGGAMTAAGSNIKITNALFYGNRTSAGPASIMAMSTSDVRITNSTFADNAPQGQQAVLLWGGSGSFNLTNSIMWNNSLNLQADPPCDVCFTVQYSDVQGYSGGEANIDQDPLFNSPPAHNYRLKSNSPCIDAGTKTGSPSFDLDGILRDASPDMGAYEYVQVEFNYQIFLPAILHKKN
jgi:hypothetical protein